MASVGVQTIGSSSLKDVFSAAGTPVSFSNSEIRLKYREFAFSDTVCRRPEPSTCEVDGTLGSNYSGASGMTCGFSKTNVPKMLTIACPTGSRRGCFRLPGTDGVNHAIALQEVFL